jgi:hypothetical protein
MWTCRCGATNWDNATSCHRCKVALETGSLGGRAPQSSTAQTGKGAKVFLSHSHADRDTAVDLNRVLTKHGGEVFLDQAHIEAGDPLPDRLKDGIRWCDRFLLLWSTTASRSRWIGEEWNYAYAEKKKILPYVLDGTPLPDLLDNLVYIDANDRDVGHANLLSAVFGRTFKPTDSTEMFPGLWRAQLAIGGLGDATYDVELRKNGQLLGSGSMGQSGIFGEIARQNGLGHLLNMKIPLRGRWSYEDRARVLTLDITADGFGTSNQEVITITTTGRERQALHGQDLAGRPWVVQRLS